MGKRVKFVVGVLLLFVVMGVLALTLFRPVTANVYHRVCSLYTEITTERAVDALYAYEPGSFAGYDVALETLSKPIPLSADEQTLYEQTVSVLLQQDLWTQRDMYDAANYLMVAMHYAFSSQNVDKISAYHRFFTRFCEDVSGEDQYGFRTERPGVSHLQFCYFASEYMRLCAISRQTTPDLPRLYEFVYQYIEAVFESGKDGWTNLGSYRARVEQILLHTEFPRSFDSALTDIELYLLATLCDLRVIAKLQGFEDSDMLRDAAVLAYKIYADADILTETEKGGYLFQVGVWKDYPDYAYSGNPEIVPGIQPKIREDIVEDSSHFSRQALWLTSFQQAQEYQEQYDLFQTRRKQLANQFVNYVIHYVDGMPLATTFMDGTCGVYRYSYDTEGIGLQGYSLSGTLMLGWWAFLEDSRIERIYCDILSQFPMCAGMENPYFDYATVREQNPFFDMDTAFDNGMMECMVMLASKLGTE